mmetsp:Transcript_14256/g.48279  ORF Transcript_14256/g.48279 Transcript_14256/m.48279 type:complete len:299 (-) Transcript_14256:282-1178(-)
MGKSGPKVSSLQQSASGGTPAITVGAAKAAPCVSEPSSPSAAALGSSTPPLTRRPPRARQSSTCWANLSRPRPSMSGPTVTPSSRPCPRRCSSASAATRCTRASATALCTSTRLGATHVCPALRSLAPTSARAARSRSASSKTTKGALPPSSRATRLTPGAHCAARALPTAVDPVKLTTRTRGSPQKAAPTSAARSRAQVTTSRSPSGAPASSRSRARARAVSGVSSDGLTTAGQPAAKAGATLRVTMAAGKFQGVTAAATPTGSRSTRSRRSLACPWSTSPATRRASSAYRRTKAAA